MRILILSISFVTFLLFNAFAQQPEYSQLKSEAETQYAAGSYSRAHELYSKVDKSKLNPSDCAGLSFVWPTPPGVRSAATQTSDLTPFNQAQKQLVELIRAVEKDPDQRSCLG